MYFLISRKKTFCTLKFPVVSLNYMFFEKLKHKKM